MSENKFLERELCHVDPFLLPRILFLRRYELCTSHAPDNKRTWKFSKHQSDILCFRRNCTTGTCLQVICYLYVFWNMNSLYKDRILGNLTYREAVLQRNTSVAIANKLCHSQKLYISSSLVKGF